MLRHSDVRGLFTLSGQTWAAVGSPPAPWFSAKTRRASGSPAMEVKWVGRLRAQCKPNFPRKQSAGRDADLSKVRLFCQLRTALALLRGHFLPEWGLAALSDFAWLTVVLRVLLLGLLLGLLLLGLLHRNSATKEQRSIDFNNLQTKQNTWPESVKITVRGLTVACQRHELVSYSCCPAGVSSWEHWSPPQPGRKQCYHSSS